MIKIRILIFIWLNFVFSLPNSQIKLYNATALKMMIVKPFVDKMKLQTLFEGLVIKANILRIIKWNHYNYAQSNLENWLYLLLTLTLISINYNLNWRNKVCFIFVKIVANIKYTKKRTKNLFYWPKPKNYI